MSQYFTIGMAGHIDHGKTALTTALTGVKTDRLKEEKERHISIEPGFAPFIDDDEFKVSIIDVPGHERFIRQMIAGVAGIDMVILVIAADEGVMPQTKEHLDIISLLGIEHGLIVMTKVDQAEQELLEIVMEDVKETVHHTFLENAPIHLVDSLSGKGISELVALLKESLMHITKKERHTSFRLPIDQVFTVKGQGAVVRGTIYDGKVKQGEQLKLLPSNKDIRVRQIERHHEQKTTALAGQRAALNLGGISHEEITRGDVLVADDFYSVANRIDVVFYPLNDIKYKIKQRQPIKLFVGTSEIMGKIIFFDRNEIHSDETKEILCQIQLEENVVVTRGDRYILRRPTPAETIGGGFIIEADAQKHRFGEETINQLKLKKDGSPKDRLESLLKEKLVLTYDDMLKLTSMSEQELAEVSEYLIEWDNGLFTLHSIFINGQDKIIDLLESYHQRFPMRRGINKAEMTSVLKQHYPVSLIEFMIKALINEEVINMTDQYVALSGVTPALPNAWKTKLENVLKTLQQQGLEVEKWDYLLAEQKIPSDLQKEFYYYLIELEKAYVLEPERLIAKEAVEIAKQKLAEHTNFEAFTLQTARECLQLTRKNLVPLLELFDRLGYTKRVENMRTWVEKTANN